MVKRGETGATNSAKRSVDLVHQRTRLHVELRRDLVQAAGVLRYLPYLANCMDKNCLNARTLHKSPQQTQVRMTLRGPEETKLDHPV